MRVPASGGAPSPALTMPEGVVTQRWPQVLPGGRQVLYSTGALAGAGFNNGNLIVQDLSGSPSKVVLKGGYHGRYVRSGHLVYVHDASLVAVPFDLARLEVTGPPVTIAQGVVVEDPTGGAQFSVSDAGMLSYSVRLGPRRRNASDVAQQQQRAAAVAGHRGAVERPTLFSRRPASRDGHHGDHPRYLGLRLGA